MKDNLVCQIDAIADHAIKLPINDLRKIFLVLRSASDKLEAEIERTRPKAGTPMELPLNLGKLLPTNDGGSAA